MSTTLKTENELPISNKKRRKGKCMPIYSKTYYDDGGDLEIVSSDNVLFKLHAYQLQSSSSVFRDMLKVGSPVMKDRIELADIDLETSKVMTGLFDIMRKDKNILDIRVTDSQAVNRRKLVIQFAQKYDFAVELRIIRYQLHNAVSNTDQHERCPRDIFDLGSMMEDHELCADLDVEKTFGERLENAKVFDLAACFLEQLSQLPIEIVWAILRASYKPSTTSGARLQSDHDAMAQRYTNLMKLPGAPKFS